MVNSFCFSPKLPARDSKTPIVMGGGGGGGGECLATNLCILILCVLVSVVLA